MPSPNPLLEAVRELRTAMERPVPNPDRPGKRHASIADGRLEAIRAVIYSTTREHPDALPPGMDEKLADLLHDIYQINLWDVEDPNRRYRRALNLLREVEYALQIPPYGYFPQLVAGVQTVSDPSGPPAPAARPGADHPPRPDGLFGADGFRFGGAEVRFGRAALQYRLVTAIWDVERNGPADPRKVQAVIDEVYGRDSETSDSTFRKLCSDTGARLTKAGCPLVIRAVQGVVWAEGCEL